MQDEKGDDEGGGGGAQGDEVGVQEAREAGDEAVDALGGFAFGVGVLRVGVGAVVAGLLGALLPGAGAVGVLFLVVVMVVRAGTGTAVG